jgi:hypothetical protein
MSHRYEILFSVPEELDRIQVLINEADQLPTGDPIREAKILGAGVGARDLLVGLTDSPPLWLAMQRQVLVSGWSFGDLEGLGGAELRPAPLLKVLNRLCGSLPPGRVADPKQLVDEACEKFRQVRYQATEAMRRKGVWVPDGESAVYIRADNSTLIDETHERLWRLRGTLVDLLGAASLKEALFPSATLESTYKPSTEENRAPEHAPDAREPEWTWDRRLMVVAETVTMVASVTTVIILAPEVWQEVQKYADSLVHIFGEVREALSREVPLLGLVIAIRRSDFALGLEPGGGIGRPEGPGGGSPPQQGGPASTPSASPAHQYPASEGLVAAQEIVAQTPIDPGAPVPPPGQSPHQDPPSSRLSSDLVRAMGSPLPATGPAQTPPMSAFPPGNLPEPTDIPGLPSWPRGSVGLPMPTTAPGDPKPDTTEDPKQTPAERPWRSPADEA